MFKIRREQKEAFAAAFGTPVTPCTTCLIVRFVDLEGLYQGGVDNRKDKPDGTTQGASRVPGYASLDDKGRIFINRDLDGTWKRDTQGIVITVRVDPPSVTIPAGTQIEWSFEDPDDPANEDPRMHRDAAKFLDPKDYDASGKKTGANANDNDPYGKAKAKPGFAQAEAKYAFSGDKTDIDPATRLSKVRFNVSDVAGDNYRVTAKITPKAPIATTTPAVTGVMTVWNRIDLEYVKMESALELPLDKLQAHFDLAFAQVDVSLKRVVKGADDMAHMGNSDSEAHLWCGIYSTKSAGQFSMEGTPGWFFVVAANRYRPEKHQWVIYEGNAIGRKNWIELPRGVVLPDAPGNVKLFNPQKVKGLAKPWPNNHDLYVIYQLTQTVRFNDAWWIQIETHDYHEVDDPDKSFLDADLVSYGFPEGSTIPIQVLNEGEENAYPIGISPGGLTDAKGHSYFGGRLIVFTKTCPASRTMAVLCHELCHAFDNAHKCGNWDWTSGPDRVACAMNYPRQFVLDDKKPRAPLRWTQHRCGPEFCAQHLRRMRDYHLQDNPGLNWK